jgi:hypothetical protein
MNVILDEIKRALVPLGLIVVKKLAMQSVSL